VAYCRCSSWRAGIGDRGMAVEGTRMATEGRDECSPTAGPDLPHARRCARGRQGRGAADRKLTDLRRAALRRPDALRGSSRSADAGAAGVMPT
jgi:hypothetical protein